MAKKNWVILVGSSKSGKKYNSIITNITAIDLNNREKFEMIVDNSMRNYSQWEHIIAHVAHGIYTGIKRTKRLDIRGNKVANADSNPVLVRLMTESEIDELKLALQPSPFNNNIFTFGA